MKKIILVLISSLIFSVSSFARGPEVSLQKTGFSFGINNINDNYSDFMQDDRNYVTYSGEKILWNISFSNNLETTITGGHLIDGIVQGVVNNIPKGLCLDTSSITGDKIKSIEYLTINGKVYTPTSGYDCNVTDIKINLEDLEPTYGFTGEDSNTSFNGGIFNSTTFHYFDQNEGILELSGDYNRDIPLYVSSGTYTKIYSINDNINKWDKLYTYVRRPYGTNIEMDIYKEDCTTLLKHFGTGDFNPPIIEWEGNDWEKEFDISDISPTNKNICVKINLYTDKLDTSPGIYDYILSYKRNDYNISYITRTDDYFKNGGEGKENVRNIVGFYTGDIQKSQIITESSLPIKRTDIEIKGDTDKKGVYVGDTIRYNLNVCNNGKEIAKNVRVSFKTNGLTNIEYRTLTFDSINPNECTVFYLDGEVVSIENLSVDTTFYLDSDSYENNYTNNNIEFSNKILFKEEIIGTDLSLNKTGYSCGEDNDCSTKNDNRDFVSYNGELVEYNLNINYTGENTIKGTMIEDELPDGICLDANSFSGKQIESIVYSNNYGRIFGYIPNKNGYDCNITDFRIYLKDLEPTYGFTGEDSNTSFNGGIFNNTEYKYLYKLGTGLVIHTRPMEVYNLQDNKNILATSLSRDGDIAVVEEIPLDRSPSYVLSGTYTREFNFPRLKKWNKFYVKQNLAEGRGYETDIKFDFYYKGCETQIPGFTGLSIEGNNGYIDISNLDSNIKNICLKITLSSTSYYDTPILYAYKFGYFVDKSFNISYKTKVNLETLLGNYEEDNEFSNYAEIYNKQDLNERNNWSEFFLGIKYSEPEEEVKGSDNEIYTSGYSCGEDNNCSTTGDNRDFVTYSGEKINYKISYSNIGNDDGINSYIINKIPNEVCLDTSSISGDFEDINYSYSSDIIDNENPILGYDCNVKQIKINLGNIKSNLKFTGDNSLTEFNGNKIDTEFNYSPYAKEYGLILKENNRIEYATAPILGGEIIEGPIEFPIRIKEPFGNYILTGTYTKEFNIDNLKGWKTLNINQYKPISSYTDIKFSFYKSGCIEEIPGFTNISFSSRFGNLDISNIKENNICLKITLYSDDSDFNQTPVLYDYSLTYYTNDLNNIEYTVKTKGNLTGDTITNKVDILSQNDINNENNSAESKLNIIKTDLILDGSVDKQNARKNDILNYNVQVCNTGKINAKDVKISNLEGNDNLIIEDNDDVNLGDLSGGDCTNWKARAKVIGSNGNAILKLSISSVTYDEDLENNNLEFSTNILSIGGGIYIPMKKVKEPVKKVEEPEENQEEEKQEEPVKKIEEPKTETPKHYSASEKKSVILTLVRDYKDIKNKIKTVKLIKETNNEIKPVKFKLSTNLPQTGTPLTKRTQIINSKYIETKYPDYLKKYSKTYIDDINYWKSALPEEDRNKDEYIVVPYNGMVIPVVRINKTSLDYKKLINGKKISWNNYLKDGALFYPGTNSDFGEVGNPVVLGHSSYFKNAPGKYKTHFQSIIELDNGDEIWVYKKVGNEYKRFTYIVNTSLETTKNDTKWLLPKGGKELTLITCTPIGTAKNRWIVRAKLKDEKQQELEAKIYGYNIPYKYKLFAEKIVNKLVNKVNSISNKKDKTDLITKQYKKIISLNEKINKLNIDNTKKEKLINLIEYIKIKYIEKLFKIK